MVKDLKIRDFLFLGAIAWMAAFMFKTCKSEHDLMVNVNSLNDTVKSYKDKNGDIVYYNSVITTKYKDLELYNDSLKSVIKDMKIKKPEFITEIVTEFRVDTIPYYFTDTLPCDDFISNVFIDSVFYKINMTLTKDSLTINSLFIPNKQTCILGVKKNGLFKRDEYVFTVKNSNPYMETSDIDVYSIKEDKRFFERPLVVGSIGLLVGAGIIILSK